MRRFFLIVVLVVAVAASAPAQHRGGGGGNGKGGGPPYGHGRGSQRMYDQDGDGIDDRFQERYRQKQLRKLVEAHYPLMNEILAILPDSSVRLVCAPGDIPDLAKIQKSELQQKAWPTPPLQFSDGSGRTITVFYTWMAPQGVLIRWMLTREADKTVGVEGIVLADRLGGFRANPAYRLPTAITWPVAAGVK